jgi:hypothetical protein
VVEFVGGLWGYVAGEMDDGRSRFEGFVIAF